jgi:hypothetical protein
MEISLNGVGPGGAQAPQRQEMAPKREMLRSAPAAPSVSKAPEPTVELAAWFDRNGDGRIDTITSVQGGDAYIRVHHQMSELLDHRSVRPPNDQRARANEAALNVYRKYSS